MSTITQLALINLGTELGVCAEVDVINCGGSKDVPVKRYNFHYWLWHIRVVLMTRTLLLW